MSKPTLGDLLREGLDAIEASDAPQEKKDAALEKLLDGMAEILTDVAKGGKVHDRGRPSVEAES